MRNWKEADLFEWLKSEYLPDLVMSNNQFSKWDCYSPEFRMRIELKCRRTHYATLLIEKPKFDAVVGKATRHNDIPMYINSTPKGVFAFNLFEVNPVWEINSKNPATTYWANKTKVQKECAYLKLSEAKKIK
tara:strand:+ start:102 stop:497 length:396 start_codon:yes stop_codon:yes gene_type:complete